MSKNKQLKPDTVPTMKSKLPPTLPLDEHIEIVSKRFPKYIHIQETKCKWKERRCYIVQARINIFNSLIAHYSVEQMNLLNKRQTDEYKQHCNKMKEELQGVTPILLFGKALN